MQGLQRLDITMSMTQRQIDSVTRYQTTTKDCRARFRTPWITAALARGTVRGPCSSLCTLHARVWCLVFGVRCSVLGVRWVQSCVQNAYNDVLHLLTPIMFGG